MRITNSNRFDRRSRIDFKTVFMFWTRVTLMVSVGLFVLFVANWFYINWGDLQGNLVFAKTGGASGSGVSSSYAVGPTYTQEQATRVIDSSENVSNNHVNVSALVLTPTYPKGHDMRHKVILAYLQQLGETDLDTWNRILDCESSAIAGYNDHDLNITNPMNGISGIWQITNETWGYAQCGEGHNWMQQTECAVKVRKLQTWSAWACY